jgi:toxin YoeB
MERYFSVQADKEYQAWRKSDKTIFKRINDLIDNIEENGFLHGIGKPEQLKYFIEPVFSRRIDKTNRLVYCSYNENDLLIISCKGHYQDK